MIKWCLWYTDGSFFTSDNGEWEDAPQFGVQCLVRFHERENGGIGAEMCNGQDLYTVDRKLALCLILPVEVKVGEEMPREDFDALMEVVRGDIHSKINV